MTVAGFLRDDGLLELEARLRDVKHVDYALASGMRVAGDPVHDLLVRVAVDRQFTVVEAEACLEAVPYPGSCDLIGPEYARLCGANLLRGFRQVVRDAFGDTRGCAHVSELLLSLPTVALQTWATFETERGSGSERPFELDRCHALDSGSETVRQYYPRWYKPSA